MQSYGVRRTHAESENKFNVTVQLKASEAAAATPVSRWEWSCLQHQPLCLDWWSNTCREHQIWPYSLIKTLTHSHLNEFTLNPFANCSASSYLSPPHPSLWYCYLNVLLKCPESYSLVKHDNRSPLSAQILNNSLRSELVISGILPCTADSFGNIWAVSMWTSTLWWYV